MHFIFIDDDAVELELFGAILARLSPPVQFTGVKNRDALFEVLGSLAELPRIIFLDYEMRPHNGLDCLKSIRSDKRFMHLPVVMYANSMRSNQVQQAYLAGADYYVRKPIKIEQVKAMIEWLMLNIREEHVSPPWESFLLDASGLQTSWGNQE